MPAARPSSWEVVSPPEQLPDPDTCLFYHVIDLPGVGVTPGMWDLRGKVDQYLGWTDFSDKRVLEIGPASGFLTAEMEKRGGDVIAVEVPENPGWDFVPFPEEMMAKVYPGRALMMRRMKQSFWYTHMTLGLAARLCYADVYNLPAAIGSFDIATLCAVLLHTKSPHLILAEIAKRTRTIIVTEMYFPDIEHIGPMMRLVPSAQNKDWGTWWHFTPHFFTQYLGVLGFTDQRINYHEQMATSEGRTAKHFTIVASKP
jgi:O-methyltransferase